MLSKGKQMIDKEIDGWSKILQDKDLPLLITWEHEVTDSSVSPFSDKLIMFNILTMMRNSVTLQGISFANCIRVNIVSAFAGSLLNLQAYAKDILDLMIKSGWQEKIPEAADGQSIIDLNQ